MPWALIRSFRKAFAMILRSNPSTSETDPISSRFRACFASSSSRNEGSSAARSKSPLTAFVYSSTATSLPVFFPARAAARMSESRSRAAADLSVRRRRPGSPAVSSFATSAVQASMDRSVIWRKSSVSAASVRQRVALDREVEGELEAGRQDVGQRRGAADARHRVACPKRAPTTEDQPRQDQDHQHTQQRGREPRAPDVGRTYDLLRRRSDAALEHRRHLVGPGTLGRVRVEHGGRDAIEVAGHGHQRADPLGLEPGVRRAAGEQLEEHGAEGVDVAGRADPLAVDLLGGHVRQALPAAGRRRTEQCDPAVGGVPDGGPPDVSVHLPGGVARGEEPRDLRDDARGLIRGERALLDKPVGKILTAQSGSALSGQMVQMLATGAWGTDTHGSIVPGEHP